MLKKFLKLCSAVSLSLCLSLGMNSSVFATDTTENIDEVTHSYSSYTLSKEEIEENIRKQLENANSVSPRMDEYLYEYVNIGTSMTSKSKYYLAQNQPSNGVVFESGGGSINWKDTSYVADTVSFSVGFSGKYTSVSIGVTPGTRVTEGTYSFSPQINSSQIGKRVKLYVAKDYKVYRYAVYRYNKYSPSNKVFVRYQDTPSTSTIYFDIRTIG